MLACRPVKEIDESLASRSFRPMRLTPSGDYRLPGRISQSMGNAVLFLLPWIPVPKSAERWIRKLHSYYQVFDDEKVTPGSSRAKWDALNLPADLTGKSLLDVGCSEGFFCMESAKSGANAVLGLDSRLISLVCAKILAVKHKADIKYQVAVFPDFRLGRQFDYVLCLSVLHHLVSTKDIWKIMSDKNYAGDKYKLEQYLRHLYSMTKEGGSCIVEMPYEYDEPDEMQHVDFELFTECFLKARFSSAGVLSKWPHTEQERKDRVIYIGVR
jgi:SAM-dependent methyltransferase